MDLLHPFWSTYTMYARSLRNLLRWIPLYYQYIKILLVCVSVRVCVTDVGVTVPNLRVMCKIITCVSAFTELEKVILLNFKLCLVR